MFLAKLFVLKKKYENFPQKSAILPQKSPRAFSCLFDVAVHDLEILIVPNSVRPRNRLHIAPQLAGPATASAEGLHLGQDHLHLILLKLLSSYHMNGIQCVHRCTSLHHHQIVTDSTIL